MLTVSNLRVIYDNNPTLAVDELHFNIGPAQSLALYGPSGCGKSSTALAILRLLAGKAKVSGEISFTGTRMSILFQNPRIYLNPVLSVETQIREVLRAHAQPPSRLETLLEQTGLHRRHQIRRAYPHQLSGGETQRVALAKALASNPSLLIADEPAANLDLPLQLELIHVLESVRNRTGLSLLLISHQRWLVERLADQIVHMSEGKEVRGA